MADKKKGGAAVKLQGCCNRPRLVTQGIGTPDGGDAIFDVMPS